MPDQPPTVRLAENETASRYEILSEAGAGGMGTVYRARDRQTDATVAMKVLRAGGDAVRFALEVRTLARLDDPHIVRYLAHGVDDHGEQFLVMEWLEGESLEELLQREHAGLRRVLDIARDVASGLAHAHEQGVIHRDLKPRNVFVTKMGAKILDFGVARVNAGSGFTQTGQVIGTPSYMAPEQARGERDIGPAADLFSFGCVLYRAIAGASPFAASDVLASLNRLASETPARLTKVPRELADLVASLLEKDPARRPKSARDVLVAIDELLRSDLAVEKAGDTDATLHSADANEAPPRRRSPVVAGAALVAILAVLAFAAVKLRAGSSSTFDRAPAIHACRTWSEELTRRQRPDGSFTGEPKREPTGWDTGQELTALARATACAKVAPSSIRAAADAMTKLRQDDGWSGPHDVGAKVPAAIAADAWVALSLSLVARSDANVRALAIEARGLLMSAQQAAGTFGMQGRADEPSTYVTTLAAWALVEGESLDHSPQAAAARKSSLEALRAAFRAPSSDVRAAAGFEEQLLWVLLEARRASADERGGDDVLRDGAADLVARCALDHAKRACTKPIYDEDRIRTHPSAHSGDMLTFWLPWVGAAADELARSDVDLRAEVRADLRTIAEWVVQVFARSEDAFAALPEYELAEYLVAASSLAAP